MSQIIKSIHEDVVKRTAARCKERGITIPTFEQLRHPERIPAAVHVIPVHGERLAIPLTRPDRQRHEAEG